jgi:hypothetical protein
MRSGRIPRQASTASARRESEHGGVSAERRCLGSTALCRDEGKGRTLQYLPAPHARQLRRERHGYSKHRPPDARPGSGRSGMNQRSGPTCRPYGACVPPGMRGYRHAAPNGAIRIAAAAFEEFAKAGVAEAAWALNHLRRGAVAQCGAPASWTAPALWRFGPAATSYLRGGDQPQA